MLGQRRSGCTARPRSSTRRTEDGTVVTAGGRVLGVTATAATLRGAVDAAYAAADQISFANRHMRRDIGRRALEEVQA